MDGEGDGMLSFHLQPAMLCSVKCDGISAEYHTKKLQIFRLHGQTMFNNTAMSTCTPYNNAHFVVLRFVCITNKAQDNLASKLHRSRFGWRMGKHTYLYL
jgi:hypothetical protein